MPKMLIIQSLSLEQILQFFIHHHSPQMVADTHGKRRVIF